MHVSQTSIREIETQSSDSISRTSLGHLKIKKNKQQRQSNSRLIKINNLNFT